jgi:hypothetical protein
MLKVGKDLDRIRKSVRFRAGDDILTSKAPPPLVIDDRWRYLPPSDQGQTSRCATEAMLACTEAARWQHLGKKEQLDAASAYTKALTREFSTNPDDGTSLFTPIEVQALDFGIIDPIALTDQRVVMDCATVDALANQIMRLKHRYNFGIMIGMNITEGMMNANSDGTIPAGNAKSLGPHGMTISGYYAPGHGNELHFVNSWGTKHAWNGILRMPWEMVFEQFLYAVGFNLIVKG